MLSHEMSSQSGEYSASAKKEKGSIKTRESSQVTMNILGNTVDPLAQKNPFSAICASASGLSQMKARLRKPSADESSQLVSSTTEFLNGDPYTLNRISCVEVNFAKASASTQQVLNASEMELDVRGDMDPFQDRDFRAQLHEPLRCHEEDMLQFSESYNNEKRLYSSIPVNREFHENEQTESLLEQPKHIYMTKAETPSQNAVQDQPEMEISDSDSDSDSDSSFSEYSVSDHRSFLPQYSPDDYIPHFLHRGPNAKLRHYWPVGQRPEICIGSFYQLNGPDNLLEGKLFAEDLAFAQLKTILKVQSYASNLQPETIKGEQFWSEGECVLTDQRNNLSASLKADLRQRSVSIETSPLRY